METITRKLQLLLFALVLHSALPAQWNFERPPTVPIQGSAFVVGAQAEVTDDKFGTPVFAQIENSYRKKALVSLHIKENDSVVLPPRVYCEVGVLVEWLDAQNTSHTAIKKLTVAFHNDTLHNDTLISYFLFDDAHHVKVTINDIYTEGVSSPLPPIFVLKPELLFERDYEFSCAQHISLSDSSKYLSSQDELEVIWTTGSWLLNSQPNSINFVYEHIFHLEWTFFDDSSEVIKSYLASGISPCSSAIFRNNATRITTTDYAYRIPLIYESGYILFRIRSAKVLPDGQIVAGTWSSDQFPNDSRFVYRVNGHQDKMNWQAATTFAEEGKRKSVVSYFDGSSKNRQTVTKINTDGLAVVAETMYDFEGRPVVTTLPSPSFDSLIKHYDLYNRNFSGNPYSWIDLDSAGAGCISGPKVMGNNYGSSKYYSVNNPLRDLLPHSNIPEAFGFPFSQTTYTNDLTNRVRASAGPGREHQFGNLNKRYTKYLYGAPNQSDLDRMFGSEVGHYSHYFKNLVIDPNGQVSITYQDMHGRTIATALSGDTVTADLQALNENSDTVMLKDAIIDSTNQSIQGVSINSTKMFIVSRRALHKFYYTLWSDDFIIKACDSSQFCYDCIYDLAITLTDECGSVLASRSKRNYTPKNDSEVFYDLTCGDTAINIIDSFDIVLDVGEYTVSKSLTIQQDAIEYYYNDYISKDTCIKTFDEFYEEALNSMDMSGCNITCESCLQSLGDSASYITQFIASILSSDTDKVLNAIDTANALSSYVALADICDRLCDSFSVCDAKRELMLHDMSPRGGQYATYTYDSSTDTYTFNDNSSILSSNVYVTVNFGGVTQGPLYATPQIVYYNDLGIRDTVLIPDGDGVMQKKTPNELTPQEFIQYWKPSWAKALLPYHPEYCKYLFCINNSASYEYDQAMLNTSDYDAAVANGFLNPLNDNHVTVPSGFHNNPHPDPFFVQSVAGVPLQSFQDQMRSYVYHTDNNQIIDYSVWEIAAMSANCTGSDVACDNCTKDYYWNAFRSIYLGMKAQLIPRIERIVCDPTLIPPGKVKRFMDVEAELDDLQGQIGGPSFIAADTNQYQSAAQDAINANRYKCSDYATYWWGQVQGCGFTAPDDSAAIISRLIDVCSKGQDASHIFGASTTPPGVVSDSGFISFEQVLQWAVDTFLNGSISYPSAACSHHLINNPLPYHVVPLYYQTVQVNKPEQCVCDNIVKYRFQYLHSGLSGSLSFAQYLTDIRNVIISEDDLKVLTDACDQSVCDILPRPVTLPYQFACNQVCANCQQLTSSYISFKSTYPNAHLHPNYLTLMQSYMNSDLGMNLTALEYMDFLYDSCGYTDFPPSDDSVSVSFFKKKPSEPVQSSSKSKKLLELFNVSIPAKSSTQVLSPKVPYNPFKHVTSSKSVLAFNAKLSYDLPFTPSKKQNNPQSDKPKFFFPNYESNSSKSNLKLDLKKMLGFTASKYRSPQSGGWGYNQQSAKSWVNAPPVYSNRNGAEYYRYEDASNRTTILPYGSDKNNIQRTSVQVEQSANQENTRHQTATHRSNVWSLRVMNINLSTDFSSSHMYYDVGKENYLGSMDVPTSNAHVHHVPSRFTSGTFTTFEGTKYVMASGGGPQVQFSIAQQTNWCDSVAAAVAEYDTMYVMSGNYSSSNFNNSMGYNLGVYYGTQTWLQIIDSCQLPCPTFVRCSRLDSVMQQFKAQHPQYADTCFASIWVSYLNQNNASGNWNWYNETDWKSFLHCCGVSYPAADTLGNRCDSIGAVVDAYASQGLGQVSYQLSNLFGWSHYQNGQWIYNDNAYWLSQMDSCGIPCNTVVNCSRLDTVMQQFTVQYPQYADTCLPPIWGELSQPEQCIWHMELV
jgi:predicted secreted protein